MLDIDKEVRISAIPVLLEERLECEKSEVELVIQLRVLCGGGCPSHEGLGLVFFPFFFKKPFRALVL